MGTTKNHHYVWAQYLKGWATEGKKLWFLTKKRKIVFDSVSLTTNTRRFYRLHDLSEPQIVYINLFISNLPEMNRGILRLQLFEICQKLSEAQEIEQVNGGVSADSEEANAIRDEYIEVIHSKIERSARKVIDKARKFPLSLSESDIFTADFLLYIGHQIARTRFFRDVVDASILKFQDQLSSFIPGLNTDKAENCGWILSYLLGTNLGVNMIDQIDDFCLTIMVNNTAESFLSSDNPVVNLMGKNFSGDVSKTNSPSPPDSFDAFYPLSPSVGILINETRSFEKGVVELDVEQVERINFALASNSNEHIFGTSKKEVVKYSKYVKPFYDKSLF